MVNRNPAQQMGEPVTKRRPVPRKKPRRVPGVHDRSPQQYDLARIGHVGFSLRGRDGGDDVLVPYVALLSLIDRLKDDDALLREYLSMDPAILARFRHGLLEVREGIEIMALRHT
jgi:hypothetical protein